MSSRRHLYSLLPAVYHLRDVDEGEPLYALLDVIDEQIGIVADGLRQLYDNWFIETCDDWAVSYIGDVVGARGDDVAIDRRLDAKAAASLDRFLFPRRGIANTVRFRKRKGTLAVLEELARDVAGWHARAVEFGSLLAVTPTARHPHLDSVRMLSVRDADRLDRMGGPFESVAHLPSVRKLDPADFTTRFGASKLGLYVWRHGSYGLRRVPAHCVRPLDENDPSARLYQVNPLNIATQLYIKPVLETEPTSIAAEHNVPAPLRLLALTALEVRPDEHAPQARPVASPAYYGRRRSLGIWVEGAQRVRFVDAHEVLPIDLGWLVDASSLPKAGQELLAKRIAELLKRLRDESYQVAVDPKRGRVVSFAQNLYVSYHYGSLGELGGGPYQREFAPPAGSSRRHRVRQDKDKVSLDEVLKVAADDPAEESIVEIIDDRVYELSTIPPLRSRQTLHLRAANGCRPVIRLRQDNCAGGLQVKLREGSRLVLDGLVISGNGLDVRPEKPDSAGAGVTAGARTAPRIEIRHCTLVPGSVRSKCEGAYRPSLELNLPGGVVVVEASIVGRIRQSSPADGPQGAARKAQVPLKLVISDSIVDGAQGGAGDRKDEREHAIRGFTDFDCRIARSTLFGRVEASTLSAQDCIFGDIVCVRRRDAGGLRFSFVPEDSQTPARYYCQPDLFQQRQTDVPGCPKEKLQVERAGPVDPPVPTFVAVDGRPARYGHAAYAQLADACRAEIRKGAEDGGEMGVFNRLALPHREQNLRQWLQEFTPVLMESEILFAN